MCSEPSGLPGSTGQGEMRDALRGLTAASRHWLVENGPRELELLFRAIVYHPSAPILIADNDRHYRDASSGAGKLLGVSREEIIGRSLDDFAEPSFQDLRYPNCGRRFWNEGEQEGTLRLVGPDGSPREVEYTAKGNVLPVRHLLVLRDKTRRDEEQPAHRQRDSRLGAGLCAVSC